MPAPNVMDVLQQQAEVNNNEIAFSFLPGICTAQGSLTYRELDARARTVRRAHRQWPTD